MIEMRNVLKTKLNKKGFTLAELLVVVAIIAILVAVSIPIFTGKLGQARVNTDIANVRAAKAAAVTEYLNDETQTNMYYDAKNGVMKATNDGIKGYNEATASQDDTGTVASNNDGRSSKKSCIVKIVITPGSDPTKPTVVPVWEAAKS